MHECYKPFEVKINDILPKTEAWFIQLKLIKNSGSHEKYIDSMAKSHLYYKLSNLLLQKNIIYSITSRRIMNTQVEN